MYHEGVMTTTETFRVKALRDVTDPATGRIALVKDAIFEAVPVDVKPRTERSFVNVPVGQGTHVLCALGDDVQRYLVPTVGIMVYRAEGLIDECIKVELSDAEPEALYRMAQNIIHQWRWTAPTTGGYDKVDFKLTFEDGDTYTGRLDIKGFGCEDNDSYIKEHVKRHLRFMAGLCKPGHISDAEYAAYLRRLPDGAVADAKRALATYDVCA